jgi:hypothetical protein
VIKTDSRLLSLIGLARAAGKASAGSVAVSEALKKKKAVMVLLAARSSENAQKEYIAAASRLGISCLILDTDQLGEAVGKPACIAVSINDAGFADAINKRINTLNNFGGAL